ncbi:MAG: single-stranded-DNA-specific exonuclease RecJ [Synechococcaceae cyanobacterium]
MEREAGSPPPAPWRLPTRLPSGLEADAARWGLPQELMAVLSRRGLSDQATVAGLLEPPQPPEASHHFADLEAAVSRLQQACTSGESVAICGDYDADGMTSTALLVGVLNQLGARPLAAIPSRQEEGYGLNRAMVERLAGSDVGLLVTVDNGVAAREALNTARDLGVDVILTDHHTLPAELPPCLALLHPARTPADSPYRTLAGVGLAYVLAAALCRRCNHREGLETALHLFSIGTVADMAPLTGVNRRWLIDGLAGMAHSRLVGLRALQQVAGLEARAMDAEMVAFQIAPRINAVGRLGDPGLVVDLLTTTDGETARRHARRCEELNRQRRELCQAIEAEATALVDADGPETPAFLLLAQNHWHHGVIGIVAARLVERYRRPVALLADEGQGRLRASVRAPLGFAVDHALNACAALLERHGGHPAAGGFTVRADRLPQLQQQLEDLAQAWLDGGGPITEVAPEAHLGFDRIDRDFWLQLQRLAPFGMGHPAPLFWTRRCRVAEARLLRGGHLQLMLEQAGEQRRAMAWRWSEGVPEASHVDVAYRLRLDHWQGQERLQLDLAALRANPDEAVLIQQRGRRYRCSVELDHLLIRNDRNRELRLGLGNASSAAVAGTVVNAMTDHGELHPYLLELEAHARSALGLTV